MASITRPKRECTKPMQAVEHGGEEREHEM